MVDAAPQWSSFTDPAVAAVRLADEPAQAGEIVSLVDCRRIGSAFDQRVRETAQRREVEPRALGVRALLHLPRVATETGQLTLTQIQVELESSAGQLRVDQAKLHWLAPRGAFRLKDLRFVADYPSARADPIFTHLHYLRSPRAGALNYALVDPVFGRPVSVCSVSPLQWRRVGRQLAGQFGTSMDAVRDVSRVYSFDTAPPNVISYLLARVRDDVRRRFPHVQLLSTAVDPNLGFTGASYLAANWKRWMTIKARPYMYHRDRYISPRQLRTEFGTTNVDLLRLTHGETIRVSNTPLLDSSIFCCRVNGKTEFVPADLQRRLYR
jgi:hypothetical protein